MARWPSACLPRMRRSPTTSSTSSRRGSSRWIGATCPWPTTRASPRCWARMSPKWRSWPRSASSTAWTCPICGDCRCGTSFDESQDISRLAGERLADRFQRGEADRFGLAGLQDGEVDDRYVDLLAELGQRHAPVVQHIVELDDHA